MRRVGGGGCEAGEREWVLSMPREVVRMKGVRGKRGGDAQGGIRVAEGLRKKVEVEEVEDGVFQGGKGVEGGEGLWRRRRRPGEFRSSPKIQRERIERDAPGANARRIERDLLFGEVGLMSQLSEKEKPSGLMAGWKTGMSKEKVETGVDGVVDDGVESERKEDSQSGSDMVVMARLSP